MMKNIWTTTIAMICAISCFSQDCKKSYENIQNSSFDNFKNSNTVQKNINSINGHIRLITKNKKPSEINIRQWNIIVKNWNQLKDRLSIYENIKPKNYADYERLKEHWHNFKSLIDRSEDQLFVSNDHTLFRAIKRVDTLVKDSLKKTVDDKSNELKAIIRDTVVNQSIQVKKLIRDTVVNQSNQVKKIITNTVVTNQDSIKYFLYKRDTTIRNSINLHGYDQNVYGLSYLQVFNPKNKSAPNAFAALAEIITSFDSFKLRNTGAFLSAGVQHRSMILLAGLGYFDNQEAYNISWKASLIYFPQQSRFGFGASYSPLTKAGIVVGFKLNKITQTINIPKT
ncbi:hypothetical protein FBD94_16840 [Pedobacter hiemivivus]|uniref:Uncharacterized protein n=1 Tax=Pedobacter hiemivivus TaxID=2530454 RepID=A0A4U1G6E9_9SPHI|nr:hypothetical protein [Pedobacter hiemivivus]TKC59198.1 hypothetical protein FBD94_16840 [Pedobacter hiemivivus]